MVVELEAVHGPVVVSDEDVGDSSLSVCLR